MRNESEAIENLGPEPTAPELHGDAHLSGSTHGAGDTDRQAEIGPPPDDMGPDPSPPHVVHHGIEFTTDGDDVVH